MEGKIKILIATFFKLDFRDKENSSKKKFIGIVFSYLFANSILSLNNYISFDKESFIILSFSSGVFLLIFIVLNDFPDLFFAKNYNEILNNLPLKDSEIISAKFLAAYLFLIIYAFIIAIPQTIFFSIYDLNFSELVFFFIANIFSLFFISGIIMVIYIFSYKSFSKKSNLILYFLQFLFFFYVIAVSSIASKFAIEKINITSLGFIKFFPQFYFALSISNPFILSILILITILINFIFFNYLKRNYSKLIKVMSNIPKRSKRKNVFVKYNELISDKFIKDNEEKASYYLTLNQFLNSKNLKLKFIPFAFLPIIVSLITFFTDTYAFQNGIALKNNVIIISPSISFTFLMCIRLIISSTKIQEDISVDVNWIYYTLPILRAKRLQNANLIFVYLNFILPVIVFLFLLLSFKIQIISLLLNLLFLLSVIFFVNSIFLNFDRVFPYSLENSKYNSITKLGEILFLLFIGFVIFIAQIFIFQSVLFIIISIFLFIAFSYFIKQKCFALKSIN